MNIDIKDEPEGYSSISQPRLIGDGGYRDGEELLGVPFSFLNPSLVEYITDVNTLIVEPSEIWEDALCYHDETMEFYTDVHDEIGIKDCTGSAK